MGNRGLLKRFVFIWHAEGEIGEFKKTAAGYKELQIALNLLMGQRI